MTFFTDADDSVNCCHEPSTQTTWVILLLFFFIFL